MILEQTWVAPGMMNPRKHALNNAKRFAANCLVFPCDSYGPSHYGALSITGNMASLPCPRHAQEQSQFRPAFLHVQDRRAKRGVRFHEAPDKSSLHHVVHSRHGGPTFVLLG